MKNISYSIDKVQVHGRSSLYKEPSGALFFLKERKK
mgnify:CR=1 FL=1